MQVRYTRDPTIDPSSIIVLLGGPSGPTCTPHPCCLVRHHAYSSRGRVTKREREREKGKGERGRGEQNVLREMNACSSVAVYVGLVELQVVVDQVVSRDKGLILVVLRRYDACSASEHAKQRIEIQIKFAESEKLSS